MGFAIKLLIGFLFINYFFAAQLYCQSFSFMELDKARGLQSRQLENLCLTKGFSLNMVKDGVAIFGKTLKTSEETIVELFQYSVDGSKFTYCTTESSYYLSIKNKIDVSSSYIYKETITSHEGRLTSVYVVRNAG